MQKSLQIYPSLAADAEKAAKIVRLATEGSTEGERDAARKALEKVAATGGHSVEDLEVAATYRNVMDKTLAPTITEEEHQFQIQQQDTDLFYQNHRNDPEFITFVQSYRSKS